LAKTVEVILGGVNPADHRVLVYYFNAGTKCLVGSCTADNAGDFDSESEAIGEFWTTSKRDELVKQIRSFIGRYNDVKVGGTDHPQAFISACAQFEKNGREGKPKHMILITDGKTHSGFQCTTQASIDRFSSLGQCKTKGSNPCKTENPENQDKIYVEENGQFKCKRPPWPPAFMQIAQTPLVHPEQPANATNMTLDPDDLGPASGPSQDKKGPGCTCECQCGLVHANDLKQKAKLTVVGIVNQHHMDREDEFDKIMAAMASNTDLYIKAEAIDADELGAVLEAKLPELQDKICD